MKLSALLAPSSLGMLSGLLLAMLTATAHHCFYAKVDRRIVQDPNEQEWFSRVGTGLAFSVKTLLAASAGLAYTQLLWYSLRRKSFTLDGLDTLFAVVNNIWKFWNWEVWRSSLALVLIAVLIWTVPIVAIFTPGTLTVQQAAHPKESIVDLAIPVIGYDVFRHFAQWGGAGDSYYSAPSNRLSRLLTTVTSQGSIRPLAAPFPNSTYSIEFFGPSISCGPTTSIDASDVAWYIKTFTSNFNPTKYVGFVPRGWTARDYDINIHDGLNDSLTNSQYVETFDKVSADHAKLYMAIPSLNTNSRVADAVVECGLYNSSFQVDFVFNNGQQDTKINNMTRLNGVSSRLSTANDCDNLSEEQVICSAAETVYIAIFDALGAQLVGRIDQLEDGPLSVTGTKITNTVLMDTVDLGRIQQRVDESLLSSHETSPPSDEAPSPISNMRLADALEQLFVNIILSLFSDPYFLYVNLLRPRVLIAPPCRSCGVYTKTICANCNHTSQNQTVATIKPVHVFTPQNAYVYKPQNLLIAYGISVVATTVVVIASLLTIVRADSSIFDSSFSTILRTTRNSELDALVGLMDSMPSKRLSNKLHAQTKLRLLNRRVVMSDVKSTREGDDPSPGPVFMIVKRADALVVQSSEAPERKMRTADVDSLLVQDEDSHLDGQA